MQVIALPEHWTARDALLVYEFLAEIPIHRPTDMLQSARQKTALIDRGSSRTGSRRVQKTVRNDSKK